MPLTNCEVDLILTCSSTCVTTNSSGAGRFGITNTKLYVPVVSLSTQDKVKVLQKLTYLFKEQLAGTNISQIQNIWTRLIFRSLGLSKFLRSKYFLYCLLKIEMVEQHI